MLTSFLLARAVLSQDEGSIEREGWGGSLHACRMPVGFISAIVLGKVLGAGLDFNLTELIVFYNPDLDLHAHFCSSSTPSASASDFCLHICHVRPFFIARLPAKNSLSYLKAGSFS